MLDCGCGGGANIKRLLKKVSARHRKGCGLPAVSVEKIPPSQRSGDPKGSLCHLAGAACSASFLPVIGSMQSQRLKPSIFWPDLAKCFREVWRVLKPAGTLLICNEVNGDTDKDKNGQKSLVA